MIATYTCDYNESFINSIGERLEYLFASILYPHNQKNPIKMVIGSPTSMQIVRLRASVLPDKVWKSSVDESLGGLVYIGEYGGPENPMNFHCFESEHVAEDEIFVFGLTGNAIIKCLNDLEGDKNG